MALCGGFGLTLSSSSSSHCCRPPIAGGVSNQGVLWGAPINGRFWGSPIEGGGVGGGPVSCRCRSPPRAAGAVTRDWGGNGDFRVSPHTHTHPQHGFCVKNPQIVYYLHPNDPVLHVTPTAARRSRDLAVSLGAETSRRRKKSHSERSGWDGGGWMYIPPPPQKKFPVPGSVPSRSGCSRPAGTVPEDEPAAQPRVAATGTVLAPE